LERPEHAPARAWAHGDEAPRPARRRDHPDHRRRSGDHVPAAQRHRARGYRCLVARDGGAAWQVLSPDVSLVLLDIMMPGQNGPEILRRMRRDPMLADIR
jgi:CheY-like chemotaxis protein